MIRIFGALLIALLCVMAIPASWIFWAFNDRYRQCVPLENGLNLGYEAVFDLSRTFLLPIAVPRLADGTPLVRDEMWALYVTRTTTYGDSFTPGSQDYYQFAWRADIGLVMRHDEPALYQKLVDEAGHANWDYGTGSYGTEILLRWLSEKPGYRARRCPTALITW